MRMNKNDVRTMAQKIQQHIAQHATAHSDNTCSQYHIVAKHNGSTLIYDSFGHLIDTIPTDYFSDIHAILRQCHPDGAYYIMHRISYTQLYARYIYIYSHGTQPSRLTYQHPAAKYPEYRAIELPNIDDIVISYDNTSRYICGTIQERINKHLSFIKQYPDISFDYTKLSQKISLTPNDNRFKMTFNTRSPKDSRDIHITMSLSLRPHNVTHRPWLHTRTVELLLQADNHNALPHLYHQHIPQLLQLISETIDSANTGYSQHEKIRVIRHIQQHLHAPDDNIMPALNTCIAIFRAHYLHDIPTQNTTSINTTPLNKRIVAYNA